MNVLELFAGAGGGILGGLILGHRPVCAVEIDPYCRRVLIERQDDGVLPPFPVWDDVRTFDGRSWAGLVDLVSGGFPCQDISSAGQGAGINGERSGLWSEFVRMVREIGPEWWYVENSPMLTSRGLGRVLSDMASLGYDAEWCVLGARDVNAPHDRDRIWILAHAQASADAPCSRAAEHGPAARDGNPPGLHWWASEPPVSRVDDGVADRVGWTRATGNGQVPGVHALAFLVLRRRLMGERS